MMNILSVWYGTMVRYCHTRLHLGFSAKLRIWQDGATKWYDFDLGTTHPLLGQNWIITLFLSMLYGVPPPSICFLSMLCGVPNPFVPLIKKVCAVFPFQYKFFCAVSLPQCNSVPLPHLEIQVELD